MNTRKLLFTALLIAMLAMGVGMALAQDDGGAADEDRTSEKRWSGFGRRGMFGRGRGHHGFGGPGMMLPGGAELMALAGDATGLEPDALRDALRGGDTLAGLIEANGGDVAAFIAEATELGQGRASARIAERVEDMVHGGHGAGRPGMGPRGFGGRNIWSLAGMEASALEVTGLEPRELFSALRAGESLAGLIEANEGDVEAFIAGISESFNARVDEAVAAGKLDEERAAGYRAGMREKLEALVHGEHTLREKGRGRRGAMGTAAEKGSGEHGRGREGAGEHGGSGGGRESGEGGPGEEAGATYTLDETFDATRKGVRLVMSWDAEAEAFVGTVENVTAATIPAVRVEVHLSNGVELGPTTPGDLAPGEIRAVELSAAGITGFDGWTPHAETGSGEHGNGGESGSG